MRIDCSRTLRDLATMTALANSASVVLLCDRELRVCMRSLGARHVFGNIHVGHSIKGLIDPRVITDLKSNPTPLIGGFDCAGTTISCIFVPGRLADEDYIALICEVGRIFDGSKMLPGVLASKSDAALELIADCVQSLLQSEPDSYIRFSRTIDRIIRARSRLALYLHPEPCNLQNGAPDIVSLSEIVGIFGDESRRSLTRHGMRLAVNVHGRSFVYNCRRDAVFSFIAASVFAQLSVSASHCVTLTLTKPIRGRALIEIDTDVAALPKCDGSIEDYCRYLHENGFTAFELDVMSGLELSRRLAWNGGYTVVDGRLRLWHELIVREFEGRYAVVRTPDESELRRIFDELAGSLGIDEPIS